VHAGAIDSDGKIHFCGDSAQQMGEKTKKCGGEEECCGSLKEYYIKTHEDGEVTTDMVAFHGCEKDIAAAIDSETVIECQGHVNTCYNASDSDIVNQEVTYAEGCFCDEDLCNDNVPDFPKPDDDTTTTACPDCRKCFSCGYRKNDAGETSELPDTPFCGDFTVMTDTTVTCPQGDCCAALKEYFISVDPDTGENHTETIGRHGCTSMLDHMHEYNVTCKDNGESCQEITDQLPDHGDNTTMLMAEVCLCNHDYCNNENPIPVPPTTPSPSTAAGW